MQDTPGKPTDFFLQSLSKEAPRDLAVETQVPTPAFMEIQSDLLCSQVFSRIPYWSQYAIGKIACRTNYKTTS